jgi:hypothetical protein
MNFCAEQSHNLFEIPDAEKYGKMWICTLIQKLIKDLNLHAEKMRNVVKFSHTEKCKEYNEFLCWKNAKCHQIFTRRKKAKNFLNFIHYKKSFLEPAVSKKMLNSTAN